MKGKPSPSQANPPRRHAPGHPRTHPPKPRQNGTLAFGMLLSTLAAVCLLAAFAVEPADAAFPGQNGRIVFESNRAGNPEIY